jgi:hypothetical protein
MNTRPGKSRERSRRKREIKNVTGEKKIEVRYLADFVGTLSG